MTPPPPTLSLQVPTPTELEGLLESIEPLPWRVVEHEYEAENWVNAVRHRTIETVNHSSQMKGPVPVVAVAYGAPTERGGMTVPVLWLLPQTAEAIVGIMNAAPALLARIKDLEEALGPFAREADLWRDDLPDYIEVARDLTIGSFRRARAALTLNKDSTHG